MNLQKVADSINVLAGFLGKRDIDELTEKELKKKYNISQVDVMILFGGSIPNGVEVFAEGINRDIAKYTIISGGEGHTTQSLRENMRLAYPSLATKGQMEADMFAEYLVHKHGIDVDYIERYSTNCGNNVTNTLELMHENKLPMNNILVIQDSTMQCRMEAGFRKYLGDTVNIINFGAYDVKVVVEDGHLTYAEDVWGMWDIDRYITLLMGEIPRLLDNEDGYGPKGQDFIAHVDIPECILEAFMYLKEHYGDYIRVANPLFMVILYAFYIY